jgi:DNA-binding response OmpR family regulator
MSRSQFDATTADDAPPTRRLQPLPTVLVVLRDPDQRTYVATSLRALGVRARLASLSRTAHHLTYPQREGQPQPALRAVVLDLSARPTAGLAAFHALRCQDADLPIIAIVRQGDDATRERCLRLDPWVVFEGPAHDEALVATVARVVSRVAEWRPRRPVTPAPERSAA